MFPLCNAHRKKKKTLTIETFKFSNTILIKNKSKHSVC